jgi:tetratricopeptide (TPR) repeat protein
MNRQYADAYINRGNVYAKKHDYDRAIADYTKAIEVNPQYADAYFNRGNVYAKKHDYDRAIADFTKVIEMKPQYADAYFNRGYVYALKGDPDQAFAYRRRRDRVHAGDYDRAIADFTRVIEIEPKRTDARVHRGFAYEALGREEDAIADFRGALALDPKDEFASRGLKRLGASP